MDTRRSIALIDDNRAWLDTLAEFLQDRGYHVRTALGARLGLALLNDFDAAAAVIDFRMPDMDGLQLLRLLRQRRQGMRVLLLSGEEDEQLESRALAEGAAAFLSKATAPALLLQMLLQSLAAATAPGGASGQLLRQLLPMLRAAGPWLPVPFSKTSGRSNP
jgi:DNA-binding response OmpR family regulator